MDVFAQLDKSTLSNDDDEATLRVTVSNASDTPLGGVNLDLVAPGLAWSSSSYPCVSVSGGGLVADRDLPARAACRFEVPLRAAAGSGTYTVTAVIAFKQATYDMESVSLGPVTLDEMFGASRWVRFARRASQVLKDLTLPILLLIASLSFSEFQKRKETRDKEKETEQAEAQEVRQLLLTKVMDLAQTYYMPIVRSAALLRNQVKKVGSSDASPARTLYTALLLAKTFEDLREQKNGLFLNSLDAEYIVMHAWSLVKTALYKVLTEEQIELALQEPAVLKTFSSFSASAAKFKTAQDKLTVWMDMGQPIGDAPGMLQDYVGALDLLKTVLRYEINRPFWKHWDLGSSRNPLRWDFEIDSSTTQLPPWDQLSKGQRADVRYLCENLHAYCGRQASSAGYPPANPSN